MLEFRPLSPKSRSSCFSIAKVVQIFLLYKLKDANLTSILNFQVDCERNIIIPVKFVSLEKIALSLHRHPKGRHI